MRNSRSALSMLTLLLGSMAGLQAQTPVGQPGMQPATRTVKVEIEAQPLASALNAWASQTGYMVLVPIEDGARRIQAPRVNGTYTPQQALDMLLARSGLSYEFVNPRTVSIRPDEKRGAAGAAGEAVPLRLARTGFGIAADTNEPAQAGATELVVTGIRDTGIVNQGVIPRQANQAVRYEMIDRAAIDRSGASNLSELLIRQIPQAANIGTGSQGTLASQGNLLNGIGAMTDTLDLRGFGSSQTLILVNGRRLYGSETQGPDISRIPLSAVERIEFSPSSGSAIYGANAMAGVVNIVLRSGYRGGELDVHFGAADGGAEEARFGWTQGMTFNEGRTSQTAFIEYRKTRPLTLGDRGYHLNLFDRYPVDSPSYVSRVVNTFTGKRATVVRSPAGGSLNIPGNPGVFFAGIPVGTDGVGLTPDSFVDTAAVAHIDTSNLDMRQLVAAQESASLFLTLEHAIDGDRLAGYFEGSYRWADNSAGGYEALPAIFTLNTTNPLNPFRTDVTPGFVGSTVIARVTPTDIPRADNSSEQQTLRLVAGLKGQFTALGARPFKWAIDASWDRNETEVENVRYGTLLRIAAGNGLYNPLKDYTVAPMLPASELEKLRATAIISHHPEIAATNWRLNGELFDMWGGPALVSIGTEYRHEYYFSSTRNLYGEESYADLPGMNGVFSPGRGDDSLERSTRGAYAGYVEMVFPLVGEHNSRPLVHSVEVAAAMRHEKYDDFSAANPPMVAVKWSLSPDLALRAQFSEGFQPPTQEQLGFVPVPFTTGFAQDSYVDPLRPGLPNVPQLEIVSGGGNPNLKPETSKTWDAGIILAPRWLPGLTVNLAYFRYDKRDQPDTLSLADAALREEFVARGPNEDTDPAGVPGPIIRIHTPYVNLSRQFSDGVDYALDYDFSTPMGNFRLFGRATQTRRFIRQVDANSPEVDSVGDLGFGGFEGVLKWRGRAGLSWSMGRWGASWAARYVDSYTQFNIGIFDPEYYTPSNIEHDVQLSYASPGGAGWRSLFEDARWTLGIMNVLDREPSFIDGGSSTSWYSKYSDPRQRFIYADFRKSF